MTSIRARKFPAVIGEDRSWLAGLHGTDQNTTVGITVSTSLFPAGAKTNGYIPSGTLVTETATKDLFGPYDAAAPAGRRHGILFQYVDTSHGDQDFGTGMLVHGTIFGSKLPGGPTAVAAVQAKLPLIIVLP